MELEQSSRKFSIKNLLFYNRNFRDIFIKCLIIAVPLLASLFVHWLLYVAVVLALGFALVDINGRSFGYIFFLFPFLNIMKNEMDSSTFFGFLLVMFVAGFFARYIIKLCKGQKKLDAKMLFSVIILVVYCLFMLGDFRLKLFVNVFVGIMLVYAFYLFLDEVKYQELAVLFAFAVCLNIVYALVLDRFDKLTIIGGDDFYSRFRALTSNPNSLSILATLSTAMLLTLFLNNKFKIAYIPLLVISSGGVLSTISKAGLITLTFVWLFFIVAYPLCNLKQFNKKKLIAYLSTILSLIAVCVILASYLKSAISRLDLKGEGLFAILSNTTTGRTEIWDIYLKALTKNAKSFLFGYGISAPSIGQYGGSADYNAHNQLLQIFYHIGVMGFVLICVCFVMGLRKKRFKDIEWKNIVVLMAVLMFAIVESTFSYKASILICLIMASLYKKTGQDVTEEPISQHLATNRTKLQKVVEQQQEIEE